MEQLAIVEPLLQVLFCRNHNEEDDFPDLELDQCIYVRSDSIAH